MAFGTAPFGAPYFAQGPFNAAAVVALAANRFIRVRPDVSQILVAADAGELLVRPDAGTVIVRADGTLIRVRADLEDVDPEI